VFVLADVEWIKVNDKKAFPTQLSAIKVDESWNIIDSFSSYINLENYGIRSCNHLAYTGASKEEIKTANNVVDVLEKIQNWLSDEDVLVWWYKDSYEYFNHWNRKFLKKKKLNRSIYISKYVCSLMELSENEKTNSYAVAERLGIDTNPELKHCSENDVRVMRELLQKAKCPQDNLVETHEKNVKEEKIRSFEHLPYRYIRSTNTIHNKDCPQIFGFEEVEGKSSMQKAVAKKYIPCDCCKKEFRVAAREIIQNKIMAKGSPYVYSPNSKVFHKCTCKAILASKEIKYSDNFRGLINTGLVPCKICNPTLEYSLESASFRNAKKKEKKISKDTLKAINRRKLAMEERQRKLCLPKEEKEKEIAVKRYEKARKVRENSVLNNQLTEEERKDIYVKTDTYYSFWVAKGYETFHSYGCSKLQGLKNLRGFRTYEEAIAAGYKPCKKCKPSAKKNQKYSIPVNTSVRFDEKIEDVRKYCEAEGYKFTFNGEYIFLETTVGKWKINTKVSPMKLEHKNLVNDPNAKEYHDQHCRFLSFTDAFFYIKEHDEKLIKRKAEGKTYVMFFEKKDYMAM